MERQLRRNRNILGISGTAVLLFAVWSVIKVFMYGYLNRNEPVGEELSFLDEYLQDETVVIAFFIIFFGLLVLDIILRVVVCLSARAESRGKKKGYGYLVVTVILLAFSVWGLFSTLRESFLVDPVDTVISLLLEGSAVFALAEVFLSSVRIKRLTKKLSSAQPAPDGAAEDGRT